MAIKNLITNETKIIELSKSSNNYRLISKKAGINKNICECWDNWYSYDNKWYYFKNFSCLKYTSLDFKFVNELIGEYLAKYLGADVVRYEIAKVDEELGLASESFVKNGNKYYFSKEIDIPNNYANMNNINLIREKCRDIYNYNELLDEIFKLVAIDIYMNQTDRSYYNYQFRKNHSFLHLAPLYDFEESFEDPFEDEYHCNLLGLKVNDIPKYNRLALFINKLLDLKIIDVINNIEEERKIIVSKEDKKHYKNYVEDRKMLLKSVVNKTNTL